MSTEIAVRPEGAIEQQQPAPGVREGTTGTLAKLADWAAEARAASTLARGLCGTSFVPKHFRDKPEETTAAILTGFELGFSPMAALRAIYVINGTPGMYAKAVVALLQSRGHDIWVESQSDESVTVCGQRKGSTHVNSCTWDRARVVKAKLTSNAKYQENPQQMLYARAASEVCRQTAMDVLMGCPYTVEELEDFDRPIRAEVAPAPRLTAAAVLGTAPATAPEPEQPAIEAAASEAPADEDSPLALPEVTKKRIFALLGEVDITDRDERIAYYSQTVGRDVGSTNELTRTEAARVIAALERYRAQSQPDGA